jgi:hypothetical protein
VAELALCGRNHACTLARDRSARPACRRRCAGGARRRLAGDIQP